MACRIPWNACVLALGLASAACEDDMESMLDASTDGGQVSGDAGGGEPRSVELSFEARMGSSVFDCAETYDDVGTSGVSISMIDFRFFVYDVRVIDEAGHEVPLTLEQDGDFQAQDVALLDFENRTGSCSNGTPETNSVVKGTATAGKIKGLRFGIGVPEALNHADPNKAPSPLNLTAMTWPWTQGYLFTRIDARVETGSGNRPAFLIHVGSDGCTGRPQAGETVTCARPNRAEIELTNFDPERDKVVLDYAKLVAEVALDMDKGGESGCMASVSDPECVSLLGRLGLDPQSGKPGSEDQVVFSVEPK